MSRSRYYCRVYEDIAKMMSVSPYGGERIGFPDDENTDESRLPTNLAYQSGFGLGGGRITLKGDQNLTSNGDVGIDLRREYLHNKTTPAGHAFVLTVVYRHEFSSSLVKTLFAGGSNTTMEDYYIVWSRGSGIVDKKD